jgi:class 3 adenylate cyclase
MQPETRYTQSGDVNIAYQVVGEGPFDVVLVPSGPSHVELAWGMANHHGEIPRRLSSFARLIVFDRRGVGMSDPVAGESLETRMDDVRAVMDAAGSSRAALFGIMDGGAMSVLFAATYPERVSALVLLASVPRMMWAADYPWGLTGEELQRRIESWRRVFFGSREDADFTRAARLVRGEAVSEKEVRADLDYVRRAWGSPSMLKGYLEASAEVDVREVLPAIRVPTLVIHGGKAASPYPAEGTRDMAGRITGARLLELPGESVIPAEAGLARALDESEAFLREAWEAGALEEPEPDRVLATILFTDIVGSSERAASLGDRAWHELLNRHHELVRRQLLRSHGTEVNTTGDGFVASFDGPARAIRCACAIAESMPELGLQIRAGLHTGECELIDGKVAGIALHIGARVAAQAQASEVLVSSTVKDLVAGSGLAFQDRGPHELKGVPGEWRLFAVEHA